MTCIWVRRKIYPNYFIDVVTLKESYKKFDAINYKISNKINLLIEGLVKESQLLYMPSKIMVNISQIFVRKEKEVLSTWEVTEFFFET